MGGTPLIRFRRKVLFTSEDAAAPLRGNLRGASAERLNHGIPVNFWSARDHKKKTPETHRLELLCEDLFITETTMCFESRCDIVRRRAGELEVVLCVLSWLETLVFLWNIIILQQTISVNIPPHWFYFASSKITLLFFAIRTRLSGIRASPNEDARKSDQFTLIWSLISNNASP